MPKRNTHSRTSRPSNQRWPNPSADLRLAALHATARTSGYPTRRLAVLCTFMTSVEYWILTKNGDPEGCWWLSVAVREHSHRYEIDHYRISNGHLQLHKASEEKILKLYKFVLRDLVKTFPHSYKAFHMSYVQTFSWLWKIRPSLMSAALCSQKQTLEAFSGGNVFYSL